MERMTIYYEPESHSEDSIQETGFQDGVSQEQLNLYSDLEDSIQETSFQNRVYSGGHWILRVGILSHQ